MVGCKPNPWKLNKADRVDTFLHTMSEKVCEILDSPSHAIVGPIRDHANKALTHEDGPLYVQSDRV